MTAQSGQNNYKLTSVVNCDDILHNNEDILKKNGEPLYGGSPFCYFVVVFKIQEVYFGQ